MPRQQICAAANHVELNVSVWQIANSPLPKIPHFAAVVVITYADIEQYLRLGAQEHRNGQAAAGTQENCESS